MFGLFIALLIGSVVGLIAALVNPKAFGRFVKQPTRKNLAQVFVGVMLISFVGAGITSSSSDTDSEDAQQQVDESNVPEYQVIATHTAERFDKKNTYHVVIDPVDLSSDEFKQAVKLVLQDLAKKNGGANFSAIIYDDIQSAETSVKSASTLTPLTSEQLNDRGQHLVANYTGGIDLLTAKVSSSADAYNIGWYPGAFTDTPRVGKYVGWEQWKPTK